MNELESYILLTEPMHTYVQSKLTVIYMLKVYCMVDCYRNIDKGSLHEDFTFHVQDIIEYRFGLA